MMTLYNTGYNIRFCKKLFNRSKIGRLAIVVLVLCLFFTGCAKVETVTGTPSPPGQPSSGPGGSEYKHGSVTMNDYGWGDNQYWIFEPASPEPSSAPVIIFNHGWIAVDPSNYGAWIEHLVRRGNIVVYPAFQAGVRTDAEEMTQNAIDAVKDAIQRLQSGGHITPELDKDAIVGHSLGGAITANMAALATSIDLPEPKAIMLAEPGEGENIGENILLSDLSTVTNKVLMLIVVGDEDTIAGNNIGRRIYNQTPQIPSSNKEYVTMFSDDYGEPPLLSDHFAPVAPDERFGEEDESVLQARVREGIHKALGADVNALDYYGFWKLFDGLIDAAFYGKNREYAFGNTPEQRFMGRWSDGKAIVELEITRSP